jgi:hypothetical protein
MQASPGCHSSVNILVYSPLNFGWLILKNYFCIVILVGAHGSVVG